MDQSEILRILEQFGLSNDEARLYFLLIQKKSLNIRSLMQDPYFSNKKRPNLYKLFHALEEKHFILHEKQGESHLFFPEDPSTVFQKILERKEEKLNKLKADTQILLTSLDNIKKLPNPKFIIEDETINGYIQSIVPKSWVIKEAPQKFSADPKFGEVFSVEFDTQRKFSANSAGLILHQYRYSEHVIKLFHNVLQYEISNMKKALDNLKNQGIFRIKKYFFEDTLVNLPNFQTPIKIKEIHVKMTVGIQGKGAICSVINNQKTNEIICIWGANIKDFRILLHNLLENYSISQIP